MQLSDVNNESLVEYMTNQIPLYFPQPCDRVSAFWSLVCNSVNFVTLAYNKTVTNLIISNLQTVALQTWSYITEY